MTDPVDAVHDARTVPREWNRTGLEFPWDRCLHELVDEQAARRPEKVAVVGPDEPLTYGELAMRSTRLAGRLAAAGVGIEDRVAVCLPRSARLVVAMLGVLKAGGAYVPLDPTYPAERLALLEGDAQASVLIAAADTRRMGIGAGIGTVVDIDEALPVDPVEPPHAPGPENIAYIIYTSGSTGRPKGVVIEHRAVVNMLYGHMAWYPFYDHDVWSQIGACGFDMSIYEMFMPLLTGATSVIATEDERLDGRLFVEFLNRHRVTVQVTTPSFLRSLGRPELPTVRMLITGGEVANLPDVVYYGPRKVFLNCYGPTEVTICTTSYQATGGETGPRLPIGWSQPNTTLYIVGSDRQLCPVGMPGEIYIGGAGLARGYWNDPALTAERFVTVPAVGDERLYRTGDRGRWRSDGSVDFLGRLTDYVKLRGYRVEPGEIEAVLIGHPAVHQAAVLMRDESLVACVVGAADSAALRAYAADRLPYYMVPGQFVQVPRIPMTEHSKVDRRALAAMLPETAPDAVAGAVGATETELRVAALWVDLLRVPALDVDAEFFALGGHSLLIAQLLERVETEFGVRVGVRDFLGAATVRGLAARIDGVAAADALVPAADAELDPVPRFPPSRRRASGAGAVLLTGATGFVGVFVLRELLARTTGEVVCLVRAPSSDAAAGRIRDAIQHYRLGIDTEERIVAVPADLARPALGLDTAARALITDRVGAIVHTGAWVHHLSSYRQAKAPNVNGTAELLRLAADGRPKRLHYVSSMSVFTAEPGSTVCEDTPTAVQRHLVSDGYAGSKWIADRMVEWASDHGLAGRIYRLGRMAGDSVRGVASLDDMFSRLVLSCAAVRAHPTEAVLDANLLPVDIAARALVALARDDDERVAYHLHHHTPVSVMRFVTVHDPQSEPVPLTEWLARVRCASRELPIQPYVPSLQELARSRMDAAPTVYRNEATLTRLASLGVPVPDITDELIANYWDYLISATRRG